MAFVLAGGQSSRMGRDKALLPWGETTLLGHALQRLADAGFSPAAVGRSVTGFPAVFDAESGQGPVAGLQAALRSLEGTGQAHALFTPVDVPLLPAEFLRWLWGRAAASGASAVLPAVAGRPQPLCAVYAAALAGPFAEALGTGQHRVLAAVPADGRDVFECEALAPLHGWAGVERWFVNLNTPEDWARVRGDRSPAGKDCI